MQGVGPGTILGGRYALRSRLTQGRDVERWSAHDTTLERDVSLTIVNSKHPNRPGVLDAARRAAGVEDTRLVRILDVGTQAGNSYIVEEALTGAESLAVVLLQGSLPAEEARRIAGEAASGLETARQRGLHHLRLTPHNVLRSPDGAIKVVGVSVAAAIDGHDELEPDAATASRRDAISVVALAYSALTGRWPLSEPVPGVEPAPRVVGGVPAPSEIAAGVPSDLDALCRLTLNEDTGPLTPGDFARQIAPWSRGLVHRARAETTVMLPVAPPAQTTTQILALPDDVGPEIAATVVNDTGAASTATTTSTAATRSDAETAFAADTGSESAAAHLADTVGSAGTAAGKAVGTAPSGAGSAADAVGGKLGGKVGSFARAAADKAVAVRAARSDPSADSERMTLPEALSAHFDEVGPPLPMLPASTAQPPSRSQSKLVVLIVASFVTLSLLVGYCGTRDLGSHLSLPDSTSKHLATVPGPAASVATNVAPSTPAATGAGPKAPVPGPTIAILSATGFDPEGDKNERNIQAPRVYDGDPATSWSSEGYSSADFGGLGKKGVGVRLDLGQPTSVNQVTLDLGDKPVDVTVYAAVKDSLDGATPIGTAAGASGQITLRAPTTMPMTQYVIVWFTTLAPDNGRFRASISEIALN